MSYVNYLFTRVFLQFCVSIYSAWAAWQDVSVIFFPGNLTYFLPIVGQSDLVTDGATNNILNSESTFFYDSNDVYCVLGRIFSGFTGRLEF